MQHVERLPSPTSAPLPPPPAGRFVPPPPSHTPSYASSQNQHYGEKHDYPHPHHPQAQNYGQAVQPWQQQQQPPAGPPYGQGQVVVQAGEAPPKKRFGGKLGGQMASAAAGGVGFGAGVSTISSSCGAAWSREGGLTVGFGRERRRRWGRGSSMLSSEEARGGGGWSAAFRSRVASCNESASLSFHLARGACRPRLAGKRQGRRRGDATDVARRSRPAQARPLHTPFAWGVASHSERSSCPIQM